MANELAAKFNDMRDFICSDRMKAQVALALPKHLDADRVLRIMMTSIQRTPKLLDCTKESMVACLLTCSQLGLEPDGASGMAYLIPYGKVATLIVGYKGLIQLAYRSEQVGDIAAVNVYENEPFAWRPCANPPIDHTPLPPSRRGAYKGSYAVISIKGAERPHVEWMWAEEIEAIRNRSRAASSGPWVTDTDEMRRKTVVRRALKYIPSSPELRTAVQQVDDQEFAPIDVQPISTSDANAASRTERLKNRLTAPELPPVDDSFDADAGREIPISADENGNTVAEPAPEPVAETPKSDDDKIINKACMDRLRKAAAAMDPDSRNSIFVDMGHAALADEGLIGSYAKALTMKQGRELATALERGDVPQTV